MIETRALNCTNENLARSLNIFSSRKRPERENEVLDLRTFYHRTVLASRNTIASEQNVLNRPKHLEGPVGRFSKFCSLALKLAGTVHSAR